MRDNLFAGSRRTCRSSRAWAESAKPSWRPSTSTATSTSYEIIWWIRAEHHDRVRDALVRLGQRLELRQATTDSARDRTVAAVLDTLQSESLVELAAGVRQRRQPA